MSETDEEIQLSSSDSTILYNGSRCSPVCDRKQGTSPTAEKSAGDTQHFVVSVEPTTWTAIKPTMRNGILVPNQAWRDFLLEIVAQFTNCILAFGYFQSMQVRKTVESYTILWYIRTRVARSINAENSKYIHNKGTMQFIASVVKHRNNGSGESPRPGWKIPSHKSFPIFRNCCQIVT